MVVKLICGSLKYIIKAGTAPGQLFRASVDPSETADSRKHHVCYYMEYIVHCNHLVWTIVL